MSDLSPLDIRSRSFKKEVRGYSKEEVNAFLEIVSKRLENALFENNRKEEKIKSLTKETENLHEKETLLENTLISAQNAVDNMKGTAQAECNRIINEAREEARRITQEANNESNKLQSQHNELLRNYGELKQHVCGLLENFLARLNE